MLIRIAAVVGLAALLAGCGSSSTSPSATPTPTQSAASSTATNIATASTSSTSSAPTSIPPTPPPTPRKQPRPTETAVLAPAYLSFVRTLCRSLRNGDAAGVNAHLMHYAYNSGLRWGMFGDGEGTTSDPSLMYSWLSGSHVQCQSFSPSNGGHGTLMTAGWARPGPWSLLDLDLLNGQWVINDFTFGSPARLARAMHSVAQPVMRYRG